MVEIKDSFARVAYTIDDSGWVRNKLGSRVAKVSGRSVSDDCGRFQLSVDSNGDVRDHGKIIGRIEGNQFKVLGHVESTYSSSGFKNEVGERISSNGDLVDFLVAWMNK